MGDKTSAIVTGKGFVQIVGYRGGWGSGRGVRTSDERLGLGDPLVLDQRLERAEHMGSHLWRQNTV